MKSMNIRSEFWYCLPVDTVKAGFSARMWSKNASTSAGCHSHGYWPVNAANRRTSDSRGLIVPSHFRKRVRCCRVHPSSIASNTAGAGSRCTTPPASTRCAAPSRSTARPTPTSVTSDATLLRWCQPSASGAGRSVDHVPASATDVPPTCGYAVDRANRMLHLLQFRPFLGRPHAAQGADHDHRRGGQLAHEDEGLVDDDVVLLGCAVQAPPDRDGQRGLGADRQAAAGVPERAV